MNKQEFIKLLEGTVIPECCTDVTAYLMPIADALMKIIPTQLFRYRTVNEYSLSGLKKNLIFFSRAKDFNDPYDSLLTAQSLEQYLSLDPKNQISLLHICQNILAEGYKIPESIRNVFPPVMLNNFVESLKENPMDVSDSCDMSKMKHLIENLISRVSYFETEARNSNSFACFSEEITSLTMWGHYADYHKGFALSYDLKPLIKQPSGILVLPIIYSSQRFDATNFLAYCLGKNIGLPVKRLDLLDVIKSSLYKSTDWAYEKEWRLINTMDTGNAHPCLQYAPNGIYYGSKISETNKEILHNIAVEKGLVEYEMHIDRSSYSYEMKFKPLLH